MPNHASSNQDHYLMPLRIRSRKNLTIFSYKVLLPLFSFQTCCSCVETDDTIHICGDYKVTVSTVSKLDAYPPPCVEDLFTALSEQLFSKLDLSHAYQQLLLDDNYKKFTTINTTRGLTVIYIVSVLQ